MILMDQQGAKIQASIKKKLISDFKNVMEEGTVRVISDFAVGSNSRSYMLVNHPFKLNFYKTTKVKVSDDFAEIINPYVFPSFGDLLMRNLDMRVAFDIVGLVVSIDPMHVTQEDGREKQK
uniref:uncharacterized protein LOC122610372 n=1 Tax=Erigeron canadensis TaxID=72917 RepID=UPI001CB95EDB|nr:uncharacterized protein LOC122610372 [Erigeron canadensis]